MRTNFDEMASNLLDGVVKLTEKDVSEQRLLHGAIDNYSMLYIQRWLECRGIKRSKRNRFS